MKQPWFLKSVGGGLTFVFLFTICAVAQGGEFIGRSMVTDDAGYVTPQVRAYIHDGALRMDVEDGVLRVGPAYRHLKELFISIRHWDGKVEEFRFPEHAHISLMLDPERGYDWHDRELHIMRAFYGGAGHFVDVTEAVRSYKHDGRVMMSVDNGTLGGDLTHPYPERCVFFISWMGSAGRS